MFLLRSALNRDCFLPIVLTSIMLPLEVILPYITVTAKNGWVTRDMKAIANEVQYKMQIRLSLGLFAAKDVDLEQQNDLFDNLS